MSIKIRIAVWILVLAGLALVAAWFIPNVLMQSFFVGISSSLLVAAIGIVALNMYLETDTRKNAVKALFFLSQEAIANFHNILLDHLWAQFGHADTGKMFDEFQKAKLSPSAIKKSSRDEIYNMFKNVPDIRKKIVALEATLAELSRMMGWSLDSHALAACLSARTAIAELLALNLDDSEEVKNEVVKGLFIVDGLSQGARSKLMEIAGIEE